MTTIRSSPDATVWNDRLVRAMPRVVAAIHELAAPVVDGRISFDVALAREPAAEPSAEPSAS